MMQQDLTPAPMLVESWSISDDFLTWTFNMREGVQFHKGWGEMTAEDFVYSQREYADGGFPLGLPSWIVSGTMRTAVWT